MFRGLSPIYAPSEGPLTREEAGQVFLTRAENTTLHRAHKHELAGANDPDQLFYGFVDCTLPHRAVHLVLPIHPQALGLRQPLLRLHAACGPWHSGGTQLQYHSRAIELNNLDH